MNNFMRLCAITTIATLSSMISLFAMNDKIHDQKDDQKQGKVEENPYNILGETFVTLPTIDVLQQKFKDADFEDFAENARLLTHYAGKKISLQALAFAVTCDLFNYLQTKSEHVRSFINEEVLEDEIASLCLVDNIKESKLLLYAWAIERKRVKEKNNKNLKN